MVKHSRKSTRRSRSRYGGRKMKTRRHRKSSHRRHAMRKLKGGYKHRCFDANGNLDPNGEFNNMGQSGPRTGCPLTSSDDY